MDCEAPSTVSSVCEKTLQCRRVHGSGKGARAHLSLPVARRAGLLRGWPDWICRTRGFRGTRSGESLHVDHVRALPRRELSRHLNSISERVCPPVPPEKFIRDFCGRFDAPVGSCESGWVCRGVGLAIDLITSGSAHEA